VLTIGLGIPFSRFSNNPQFTNQIRAALNPLGSILDGVQIARLAPVHSFVSDCAFIGRRRLGALWANHHGCRPVLMAI
jgi:hypothetical protein